jgi:hypothetical protein
MAAPKGNTNYMEPLKRLYALIMFFAVTLLMIIPFFAVLIIRGADTSSSMMDNTAGKFLEYFD